VSSSERKVDSFISSKHFLQTLAASDELSDHKQSVSEHIGQVICDAIAILPIEEFDGEDKSEMNDLSMVKSFCKFPQKYGELAIDILQL
jgi:hypothetical protein